MSDVFSAASLATDAPAAPAAEPAVTSPPVVDPAATAVPADAAQVDVAKADDAAPVFPGKDATPEQLSEFFNKIGRPETPDAYELPVPEGDNGEFAKQIAPVLHKHGLTAAQAKGLAEDWNAMQAESIKAYEAQLESEAKALDVKNRAEEGELKNEWGQKYDENMHFAKLAVKDFFPKEKAGDVIAAIESKIGYKETVKFMNALGKGFAESDAVGLGGQPAQPQKTMAQILYPSSNS